MAKFNLQLTTGDDVPARTEAEFQFVSRQLRRAETVALAAPMFVPLIEFLSGTLRGWFGDKIDNAFSEGVSAGRRFPDAPAPYGGPSEDPNADGDQG